MFHPHNPKKKLSQNFLKDENIQKKIVSLLDVSNVEHILEIGPGLGALTKHLLLLPKRLTIVEYDKELVQHWEKQEKKPYSIIHNDILKTNLSQISLSQKLAVIGNIPYGITTPILFYLLEERQIISSLVLMIQKEVARRLTAKKNSKEYGILGILYSFFADIHYAFTVPNTVFYPRPKVDSAVITINFRKSPSKCNNYFFFKEIVQKTFHKRRKMLRVSLREYDCRNTSIDLSRRPESLSLSEFITLANELS